MNETVSSRRQITLPAVMRMPGELKGGDVLILEDRGAEIVLKPEVVLEARTTTMNRLREWDAADRLSDRERARFDKPSGPVVSDANVTFPATHNPRCKAALVVRLIQAGTFGRTTPVFMRWRTRRDLALKVSGS